MEGDPLESPPTSPILPSSPLLHYSTSVSPGLVALFSACFFIPVILRNLIPVYLAYCCCVQDNCEEIRILKSYPRLSSQFRSEGLSLVVVVSWPIARNNTIQPAYDNCLDENCGRMKNGCTMSKIINNVPHDWTDFFLFCAIRGAHSHRIFNSFPSTGNAFSLSPPGLSRRLFGLRPSTLRDIRRWSTEVRAIAIEVSFFFYTEPHFCPEIRDI